jgi:hypothetical protein
MKTIRLLAIFASSILLGLVINSELDSLLLRIVLIISLTSVVLFWYFQKDLRM